MCPTTRLSTGPTEANDRFRSPAHAMEYMQRVEKGRRVRTDAEIETLIKLAAQGAGVAGTIQAALGLHALHRQLNRLFDAFSPPGKAVLDELKSLQFVGAFFVVSARRLPHLAISTPVDGPEFCGSRRPSTAAGAAVPFAPFTPPANKLKQRLADLRITLPSSPLPPATGPPQLWN